MPALTVLLDNRGLAHRVDLHPMDSSFVAHCNTNLYWWLSDFTEESFAKIVVLAPTCMACIMKG